MKLFEMKELETLKRRLSKIGIDIRLASNYPWVYLDQVNGNKVKKHYWSDHGFTIGFLPIKGSKFNYMDLSMIFETIRKYL